MAGALACPACPAGQLARQRDPLCRACAQAAQEVVSWPLWVFDSPLLRQTLADLNLPAVPAIVQAACGLTQGDLAGVAGWRVWTRISWCTDVSLCTDAMRSLPWPSSLIIARVIGAECSRR